MENIQVTLPGGQSIEVRRGVRIDELMSATDGNKKDVIAAKVDGHLVDLSRALEKNCALEWISMDSPEGLDVLRHSTAHLMAQAVQSLFPGTQVTIGPTIENGFYYDFKRAEAFSQEELEKIEKRMAELAQAKLTITREEVARGEAIEMFRKMGEDYKVEIIQGIPEDTVSLYRKAAAPIHLG